jgi:hypothetical protein
MDDSGFGAVVAVNRQEVVERYGKLAKEQGHSDDPDAWFQRQRVISGPGRRVSSGLTNDYVRTEANPRPVSLATRGSRNS